MSYRTILVHADLSRHAERRIRLAAGLACRFGAHLVGTAVIGMPRFLLPGSIETGGQMLIDQIAEMQAAAQRALRQFDTLAADAGVPSYEQRYVNDDIDGGIALQARYADLLVLSQRDPSESEPGRPHDLVEYLLMNSAHPVLLLPYAGHVAHLGGRALVAWDGSLEATRAVTAALPLLKQARHVGVLVFNPDDGYGTHGEHPGADLALYLARHGVNVTVAGQSTAPVTGEALLSHAADASADLLVMGGYGHARFREMLMGGVTRTILRSMTLPVLMAH
jgi:nucleotide-binding universal stress UspA family protein